MASDVTPKTLRDLADSVRNKAQTNDANIRMAIVASDDRLFAMARLFATHASCPSTLTVVVTRNHCDALGWLEQCDNVQFAGMQLLA